MKNFFKLVLLFVFILSLSDLSAQKLKKGEMVGQAGLGFGLAGVYGDAGFPPISVGLQYGLEDKISIGGIVGFTTSSEEWYWGKWSYSYVVIGGRGEYHFLEDSENIDAYGGITLGYAIVSSSWEDNGYLGYHYDASASASYAVYGFHAGARYYLSPKFALFGELGYGISYITVGAAFKL